MIGDFTRAKPYNLKGKLLSAQVVKLVDTQVSEACFRKDVLVQVQSRAPLVTLAEPTRFLIKILLLLAADLSPLCHSIRIQVRIRNLIKPKPKENKENSDLRSMSKSLILIIEAILQSIIGGMI